jgi:hypothetical protein
VLDENGVHDGLSAVHCTDLPDGLPGGVVGLPGEGVEVAGVLVVGALGALGVVGVVVVGVVVVGVGVGTSAATHFPWALRASDWPAAA